jgi:membrane protease YdiL (CAAX protease family)
MWMNFFNKNSSRTIKDENTDRCDSLTVLSKLFPPYSDTSSLSKKNKEILFAVVCTVVVYPLRLAIVMIEECLRSAPNIPLKKTSISFHSDELNMNELIIILVIMCIISPIIEEVVIRGMLTPAIRWTLEKTQVMSHSAAKASAILCSALFFASLHGGQKSGRFLGAITYEFLMATTDNNLRSAIAAHFTHNSIVVGEALLERYLG